MDAASRMAWEGLAVLLNHMCGQIGWQNSLALTCLTLGEIAVVSAPGIQGEDVRRLAEMLQQNIKNGVEQRALESTEVSGNA